MPHLRAGLAILLALLSLTAGCRTLIGVMGYYFRPRQIQKPEYEFADGDRVAIVIEAARARFENPVFDRGLYERVVQMLREGESKGTVLPYRSLADLRQDHPGVEKWSLQHIGRELQAGYVLYIKLDRLIIRQTPDYPALTPTVDLHMKLVSVSQPGPHARVWPQDKQGHAVSCSRQVRAVSESDPDAADTEATKLAYDTAYYVTMPFIEVDLEENPPVEP